jgi:membrane associated rhomboid family serine protease
MTPLVGALVGLNVLMFFVSSAMPDLYSAFRFVPAAVGSRPWTLITYMFLHGDLYHLLFNMMSLFFFGSQVESKLGTRRFGELYFASGMAGALLSLLLSSHSSIIGASAGVFGVMLAFARYWPETEILIFFVIPVKARVLVILTTIFALFAVRTGLQAGVAHFAHLGGYVGAWAYITWLERFTGARKFRKRAVAPVKDVEIKNWKRVDPASVHVVNRDELNRILDKVNEKGLAALTPEERRFLMSFVPPDDRPPLVS